MKSALNCASFEPHIDHFQPNFFLVLFSEKDDIRTHENTPSKITTCQIKNTLSNFNLEFIYASNYEWVRIFLKLETPYCT